MSPHPRPWRLGRYDLASGGQRGADMQTPLSRACCVRRRWRQRDDRRTARHAGGRQLRSAAGRCVLAAHPEPRTHGHRRGYLAYVAAVDGGPGRDQTPGTCNNRIRHDRTCGRHCCGPLSVPKLTISTPQAMLRQHQCFVSVHTQQPKRPAFGMVCSNNVTVPA